MTPCKMKGYEVGQVFERIDGNFSDIKIGDVLVLIHDDDTDAPKFQAVSGCGVGKTRWLYLNNVRRIYPPEEPVETIELMGKTYSKEEIEKALSNVKPID